MGYDPQRHHRRSIRLRGYDYTQAGAYFVTICTQNRESLFGDIVDGEMRLNDAGRMVQTVWDELPDHYPGVDTDAFVIMPNHVHAIIVLTDVPPTPAPGNVGATPRGCPDDARGCTVDPRGRPPDDAPRGRPPDGRPNRRPDDGPHDGQARGPAPTTATTTGATTVGENGARLSLPDAVHRFKSFTTACYRHGVTQNGWPRFPGRLWQRNYYEHIISNEDELQRIRQYIAQNPANWASDRENPDHKIEGKDDDEGSLQRNRI